MNCSFSITEKEKKILHYAIFSIIIFISLFIRAIIYLKIKIFPPTTDATYHSLLTQMILNQKTPFIFWESGMPVSYPPAFATLSAGISSLFGIPSFRGAWACVILVLCLQVFIAYLLGNEIRGKNMGLASALFFGIGLFPWTPFLLGGMYANILGQTVMLFLLFLILKWRLRSVINVLISSLFLALLITSHFISLISFFFAFVSLLIYLWYKKAGIKMVSIVAFLFIGTLCALPWLIHIYPSLKFRVPVPLEYVLGPTEGLQMIYYRYALLPLFSLIAFYPIIKKKDTGLIIILWGVLLFSLSVLVWKNRFGMELYIPLDFLAAYGFLFTFEQGYSFMKKLHPASILLLFLVAYFLISATGDIIIQPRPFITHEVDESNYEAMKWVRENTEPGELFYASTISSYIAYFIVYTDRKVINYSIESSTERLMEGQSDADEIEAIEKVAQPGLFGGELFYETMRKYDVSYIYLFNKGGVTEWRNLGTGMTTFITKDSILAERTDLYEVVYENKYVKIYRIIKRGFYETTMTSS